MKEWPPLPRDIVERRYYIDLASKTKMLLDLEHQAKIVRDHELAVKKRREEEEYADWVEKTNQRVKAINTSIREAYNGWIGKPPVV